MKLVITGAGGFLGSEIARQARADARVSSLRLVDVCALDDPEGAEVRRGDLCDPEFLGSVLHRADAVIHLAALLGGAAERDRVAARAVNVDVPLSMIEVLRGTETRFVFASSIAVLAADLPDPVDDAAPVAPLMVYGAHKAMVETALACEARNDRLDAVSLRPSGIMARDGVDAALKSAFLSRLFWAVRRGEDITLPVPETGRSWLASVTMTARNFLHGALDASQMPVEPVTLPALAPSFAELVAALKARFPDSPSQVTFAPEAEATRLFAAFPELITDRADAAGFLRDPDLSALIDGALNDPEET